MQMIDLTHLIVEDMPVYPGTEQPVLDIANTLDKDGFVEKKMIMYSHTGTHIDAPYHLLEEGMTLDSYSIDQFLGKAVLIDVETIENQHIELIHILPYKDIIEKSDFVIIKTGWSKYWGSDDYFKDFPYLTEECAMWLSNIRLKGIGLDTISIDPVNTDELLNHKIFMKQEIVIIENLCNLEQIWKEIFYLSVFPLKIQCSDGSPVRAVAIMD